MGTPSDKLAVWLKARLTTLDVAEGETSITTRFELYHAIDGEGSTRIHTMSVTTPMNADETARELWGIAEQDSETRTSGVPQRYLVAAFCTDEREPTHSYPFIVRSNPLSVSKLFGQDTEPPTDKGMIAHVMRHDETMHRMVMMMTDATAGKLAQQNLQKDDRIAFLENKQTEFFELSQKLLDRTQERELERGETLQRSKRMDEVVGMAMAFLPVVLGGITGKFAPKAAATTARDKAIKNLLDNLSEQEALNVLSAMGPTNQALMIQLFQSYQEERKKEQASKPPILRNNPTEESSDEQKEKSL